MKCETVIKITNSGEYEVLYSGPNRGEARRVYKEMMTRKNEFLALFQQSGYSSRTMSKGGFLAHNAKEELKPVTPKKKRKKKVVEEAPIVLED